MTYMTATFLTYCITRPYTTYPVTLSKLSQTSGVYSCSDYVILVDRRLYLYLCLAGVWFMVYGVWYVLRALWCVVCAGARHSN